MGRGNFCKDGLRSNAIEPIVDGNFFDGKRDSHPLSRETISRASIKGVFLR